MGKYKSIFFICYCLKSKLMKPSEPLCIRVSDAVLSVGIHKPKPIKNWYRNSMKKNPNRKKLGFLFISIVTTTIAIPQIP